MTEMNVFEKASRLKLRFQSDRGELTTEQLWDLPLQSKTGFDLDNVAKAVNASLKSVTEESFVTTTSNPAKDRYALMLEIVKYVIATKQAENAAMAAAAAKRIERDKLIAIYGSKQDAALQELTPEQLMERINALGQ